MRLIAKQDVVARLETEYVAVGDSQDGWVRTYLDSGSGERWLRTYLGSEYHGGGLPILVREPMPGIDELLELVAESADMTEVAAGAWLLEDVDREGGYKARLIGVAEESAKSGDYVRAMLLVVWGDLANEMNLRPVLGKPSADVVADHQHFRLIAARSKMLLQGRPSSRDRALFGYR